MYARHCYRFYYIQPYLVYRPRTNIDVECGEYTIEHERIKYRTRDGILIDAWYVPVEDAVGVVLFCHGNAGNISQRIDSFKLFAKLKLSSFIFDYRGYGYSEGYPTEEGTYLDAEGAWDYMVNELKIPPEKILVFGRSLGGGIATYIAMNHNPRALIIESSFMSAKVMAGQIFPFAPRSLLLRFKYNSIDRMKDIHCPTLIIHSQEDAVIPYSHGVALFNAANPPKKFLRINGAHLNGFWRSRGIYDEGIREFFKEHVPEFYTPPDENPT